MRTILRVALAVGMLAACGGESEEVGPTVTGTFTLRSARVVGTPTDCRGTGGYDDFRAGQGVTLRDGEGAVIGTGRTDSDPDASPAETRLLVVCTLTFEVEADRPADFYTIEIGRRGEQSYSHAELAEKDWHVEFTLG